jgi:hypothetical protein
MCEQPFQRYNLAKFPCQLKRLQAGYEKLIEICVISLGILKQQQQQKKKEILCFFSS